MLSRCSSACRYNDFDIILLRFSQLVSLTQLPSCYVIRMVSLGVARWLVHVGRCAVFVCLSACCVLVCMLRAACSVLRADRCVLGAGL